MECEREKGERGRKEIGERGIGERMKREGKGNGNGRKGKETGKEKELYEFISTSAYRCREVRRVYFNTNASKTMR